MIHTVINKYKNEEGSGLVLSLMVLLVLSVLGSALGIITVGSHKLADINRDSISAYYVAEAGANIAYEELKQGVMDTYRVSETADFFYTNSAGFKGVIDKVSEKNYSEEFSTQNGKQPIAEISIEGPMGSGDEREYIITSIGKIDGKTRVVDKVFELSYVPKNSGDTDLGIPFPLNNAAIVFKELLKVESVTGKALVINGNIIKHPEGDSPKSFIPTNGTVTIDADYPWSTWDDYTVDVKKQIAIPQLIKPENFKKIEAVQTDEIITVTEDSYLSNLIINNNNNLTIDTKGKNVDLLVDRMEIDNGTLDVIGGGTLRIFYGGNQITFQNKVILNNVTIISTQANLITNANLIVSNGHIIANGSIELGNDPKVTGNIISTSSITLHNATVIGDILAGGAITMTNKDTNITGNIISKGKISLDNSTVDGIIITENDIVIGNESKVKPLIFAPKGSVSITGHGFEMTGSIIANKVWLSERGTVTYDDMFLEYISKDDSSSEMIRLEELISSSPAIEK